MRSNALRRRLSSVPFFFYPRRGFFLLSPALAASRMKGEPPDKTRGGSAGQDTTDDPNETEHGRFNLV